VHFLLKTIFQQLYDVSSALHRSLESSGLSDVSLEFLEQIFLWYKTRIMSVCLSDKMQSYSSLILEFSVL